MSQQVVKYQLYSILQVRHIMSQQVVKYQLYSKEVSRQMSTNNKINNFPQPLTMPFQIFKNCCKILDILMYKMYNFLLTGCMHINCKIVLCHPFLCLTQAFYKAKNLSKSDNLKWAKTKIQFGGSLKIMFTVPLAFSFFGANLFLGSIKWSCKL